MTFAADDAEAAARFGRTKADDPFPDIAPALLNTADLLDYIAATGMIHPFTLPEPLDKFLKPASCAISFAGPVRRWNPDPENPAKTEIVAQDLKPGEKLKLPRNSITFITLAPYFRFPDYIAGRYNLAIHHIYRGLLVGTGPLVDPGFEGVLSVPVHNLTAQDYELTAGESLVWMEFTKLSDHARWNNSARSSNFQYVEFPPRKLERKGVVDYLKAASAGPVVSSIPAEVGAARVAAEKAAGAARTVRNLGLFGGVALLAAIGALLVEVSSAVRDEGKDRTALERRVDDLRHTVTDQRRDIDAARRAARRAAARASTKSGRGG